MADLCDELTRSEEQRFGDVKQVRENANRMVSEFNSGRLTMGKDVRAGLENFREVLEKSRAELVKETKKFLKDIGKFLKENRNEQAQRRKEITEAFDVWQKFAKRSIAVPKRPTARRATKPSSRTGTVTEKSRE